MEKRRIVLYGNSVIIGTFECSLRELPRYEVLSSSPSDKHGLAELAPDVVLFDLEDSRPEAAFRMLESCPGLTLVGISPDNNMVKVWSSKQLRELSTQDLIGVIDEQIKYVPSEIGERGAND